MRAGIDMSKSKTFFTVFGSFLLVVGDVNASSSSSIDVNTICSAAKEWKVEDLHKQRQLRVAMLLDEYRKKELSIEMALKLEPTSMYVLGNELLLSEDAEEYAAGVELLQRAAFLGETPALARLGMHFVNRTAEVETGLQLLHCAAMKGRFDAAAFLGNYYGFSPGKNPTKAVLYLELAVEAGVSLSQHQLAGLLLRGEHVQKNEERAARLYKEAAEAGVLQSRFMYAYLLETGGAGQKPDYFAAIQWYLRAADSEWREGPPEAARLMHLIGQQEEAEDLLNQEAAKNAIGSERAKELLLMLEGMKKKE